MTIEAFSPSGSSVKVAATTTTGQVSLGAVAKSVRVFNAAAAPAFIAFGVSAATAAVDGTASVPVAAGATEVFSVNRTITHAAAILTTGTGDVWFTPGDGA